VLGFAVLAEDQVLEFLGAHEGARHGGGHAQLDEEIDEYEAWFEHRISSLASYQGIASAMPFVIQNHAPSEAACRNRPQGQPLKELSFRRDPRYR
jgi:hypothetical protein